MTHGPEFSDENDDSFYADLALQDLEAMIANLGSALVSLSTDLKINDLEKQFDPPIEDK